MKTHEIQKLLGVPPSTFCDWKNPSHEKQALAMLLSEIPLTTAMALIASAQKKASAKPIMLMSTVNCSIGDKSKHLKLGQVKALLLGKEPTSSIEKYALKTIKTEASKDEIEHFANYYKIPIKKIEGVLYGQY